MTDFLTDDKIKALIVLCAFLCVILIHLHSSYCDSRYRRGYDRVWDDPVFKSDIILAVIADFLAALLALAALSFT